MNLYFWLFSLCAVLMTPIGAQLHIRLDGQVHYRIRLRAAGLPLLRKKKQEEPDIPLPSGNMMKQFRNWDYGFLTSLVRQGHFSRLFRLFEWHDAAVYARISFEDAALTALVYGLIRNALQTAAHIRPLPVKGRVEMDFRGEGTWISLRCIATARLGSLMAAAIRLWLAAVSYRAKCSVSEEETYAASH